MSRRALSRVGVIADLHLPFEHPEYLRFCVDTFREWGCNTFVNIGDVTDNHAVAPNYDPDSDGFSAGDEGEMAKRALKPWVKAFPKLLVCYGNHDLRPVWTGKKHGLSDLHIRTPAEVLGTPKGWKWGFSHEIDGVLYEHGTGSSGPMAARKRALEQRCSLVMGHIHSGAGVVVMANKRDRIFAMNVGCGIDVAKYAFAYGEDRLQRPVLGCGIVLEGKEAYFIPMPCSKGEKYQRKH